MGNATSSTETVSPVTPKRGHKEKRFLIGLCGLLVFGLPFVWFWRQAHARYTVVGKTDPATGYRAVYTVSKSWKKEPLDLRINTKAFDLWMFTAPSPGQLQNWLNAHLFHRSLANDFGILAGTDRNDSLGLGWKTDAQGYTHIAFEKHTNWQILSQERFLVSGHPATWFLYRDSTSHGYECVLMVKPLHQSIAYGLVGISDNREHFLLLQQEMRAIRDSFRIEKVSVSKTLQSELRRHRDDRITGGEIRGE